MDEQHDEVIIGIDMSNHKFDIALLKNNKLKQKKYRNQWGQTDPPPV